MTSIEMTITGREVKTNDEISIFGSWQGIVVTEIMDDIFIVTGGIVFQRSETPFVIRRAVAE